MSERYKICENTNCYLVTSSTVEWLPVFVSGETCRVITSSLDYCRRHKGLKVFAYVVMPTHFHAILASDSPKDLSNIMRDLKRHTSRELIQVLEKSNCRVALSAFQSAGRDAKGNEDYKLWQDGYHPKGIFLEDVLRQKIEYVHQNPVRKGLVERVEDWLFSSARNYFERESILEIDRYF